jgi:predicted RNA-binding protein YlqC (UPF0109 family)
MSDSHAETYEMLMAIVRALVDHPEEARVLPAQAYPVSFHVQVGPADLGKIIGKQGRTARAIRLLVSASGHKGKQSVGVDFDASPAGPTAPAESI